MQRSLRVLYLAINVACGVVYLYAIHRVTSLMALEQRTAADGVDGISFFAVAAPAIVLALLVSAVWLAKALVDVSRNKDYRAIKWLGAVATVWLAVFLGGRLL
jgi:hypothetical protein